MRNNRIWTCLWTFEQPRFKERFGKSCVRYDAARRGHRETLLNRWASQERYVLSDVRVRQIRWRLSFPVIELCERIAVLAGIAGESSASRSCWIKRKG